MASMAKVWLGLATMCVLSVGLGSERPTDADNQFIRDTTIRFSKLSRADLLNVWHSESHRRCRHQLILALDLACRFDPYRINATGHGKRRATKKPRTKLAIRDDSPNKTVDKQLSPDDIPYIISKIEAMSYLSDEKDEIRRRWRRRRPVYLQEECSLEEHDAGCRTHRSLAKDSSNPDTRNPSPLSQKDQSSEEDKRCGDVDSCSWEQYGEGCKRHPSRENELAPFTSKKSALSFLGENHLGQGKTSGSLVGECCLDKGCFWEELAEYCHEHPRQQTERESVCPIN